MVDDVYVNVALKFSVTINVNINIRGLCLSKETPFQRGCFNHILSLIVGLQVNWLRLIEHVISLNHSVHLILHLNTWSCRYSSSFSRAAQFVLRLGVC